MNGHKPEFPIFLIGLLCFMILVGGVACAILGAGDTSNVGVSSPSPSVAVNISQTSAVITATSQASSTGTPGRFASSPIQSATGFVWVPGKNEVLLTTENEVQAISLSPSLAPSDLMPGTGYFPADNPSLLSVAREKAIVSWADDERLISVWQASPNPQISTLDQSDSPITGMALSPQGDQLAFSDYDHQMEIWDIVDKQRLDSWQVPSWLVNLSYSPDENQIGGVDLANFIVYIFNSETGEVERTLQWSESASPALYGVFFSPDWRYLAWVARNSVQIMSLESGDLGPQLIHEDFVNAVSWSPDSSLLAVGAAGTVDGAFVPEIVIWDIQTGQPVETRGEQASIVSLSFSPDGGQLGILNSSGVFQIWKLK
jgi:hypothetical protein